MKKLSLPTPALKGTVFLTLTNCETGEVEGEYSEDNIVLFSPDAETAFASYSQWAAGSGGASNQWPRRRIYLLEDHYDPHYTQFYMINTGTPRSSNLTGNNVHTFSSGNEGVNNPDYLEYFQKFNAPTNTRIINSLYVSADESTQRYATQLVTLSVPFRQLGTANTEGSPGQDLSVRWRLEFYYDTRSQSSPTDVWVHPYFGFFVAHVWVGGLLFDNNDPRIEWRYPWDTEVYWQNEVAADEPAWVSVPYTNSIDFVDSRSQSSRYFRVYYDQVDSESQNVGLMYGQFAYGNYQSTNTYPGHTIAAPVLPPSFANKPIHPVFNHGPNNTTPFQNTSELASKNGIVTISEGSGGWDNPDYPKHFRIDIQKSGDTGNSRYWFNVRPTFGYNGSSWDHVSAYNRFYRPDNDITPNYFTADSANAFHEQYSEREWIMFDWKNSGFTIVDIVDGSLLTIDDSNGPVNLPSGARINQITVSEEDQTIWVADYINGLHKIRLGSPATITTYDATTIYGGTPPGLGGVSGTGSPGVHDGEPTGVMAVDIGYQGRVWVVLDGAIAWTEDDGASWTAYDSTTTPAITDSSIDGRFWQASSTTDGIDKLICDKSSPKHEMMLVEDRNESGGDGTGDKAMRCYWWRQEEGSPSVGTTIRMLDTDSSSNLEYWDDFFNYGNPFAYHQVGVSREGGTWTIHLNGGTNARSLYAFEWGNTQLSNTLDRLGSNNDSDTRDTALFSYDWFGTPYTNGAGDNVRRLFHGSQHTSTATSNLALGDWTTHNRALTTWKGRRGAIGTDFSTHLVSQPQENSYGYDDGFEGRYTPFHQISIDEYRWDSDGSPGRWRKNWWYRALDTASHGTGPHDGVRIGFDTEDHEFKGMSAINVSNIFGGSPRGITTNKMTVVMTVKGKAKLDPGSASLQQAGQTEDRCLFGIGAENLDRIELFWDASSQMRIEDHAGGENLTATPSDYAGDVADVHRVVAVIDASLGGSPNGWIINVYLDGSHIGPEYAGDVKTFDGIIDMWIGATTKYRRHGLQQHFAGFLEDVQIWDSAWTSGEVSSDYSGWTSASPVKEPYLSSASGNLIARYLLTDDLTDKETKPTHGTEEEMVENINIKFQDSSDTPAFQADDWYTCVLYDGLLKDNATSFATRFYAYFKPTDTDFTDIKNASGTNIIPGSDEEFTEDAVFVSNTGSVRGYPRSSAFTNANSPGNWTTYGSKAFQHMKSGTDGWFEWTIPSVATNNVGIGLSKDSSISSPHFDHTNSTYSAFTVTFLNSSVNATYSVVGNVAGGAGVGKWIVSGDHVDEIAPGSFVTIFNDSGGAPTGGDNGPYEVLSVALVGSPATTEITIGSGGNVITGIANNNGSMRVAQRGYVQVRENGSVVLTTDPIFYTGDRFRITRDGGTGTFEFQKYTGGSPEWETIHISSITNTADLWPVINYRDSGMSVKDMRIHYTRDAYTMNIGNMVGSPQTGKWDSYFWAYHEEDENILEISIEQGGSPGGSPAFVPAAIITNAQDDTVFDNTASPSVSGEVVLCDSKTGVLKFHPDDAGKAVEGSFSVIYLK